MLVCKDFSGYVVRKVNDFFQGWVLKFKINIFWTCFSDPLKRLKKFYVSFYKKLYLFFTYNFWRRVTMISLALLPCLITESGNLEKKFME